MAQCKQSPQDFIRNAFTPQIAVVCTPLAEKHCQKNNLNFIELLRPFSKLSNDVHYKDPNGSTITIRNLKLTFLDVESRPPQTSSARSYLNASVSELSESRAESFISGNHQLQIALTTPWFEVWRDTFLRVQYPSDHEYTKHFLSCILVVSSSEINPVESLIQLAQHLNSTQHNSPGKLPKWFNSNILKYYVIIHDIVEGNAVKAGEAYEALKVAYGEANCFLLRMNSRPPGFSDSDHLADPWSQFISSNIESREKETPESSPYSSRANFTPTSPEMGDTTTGLDYHPLSPETEELSLNNLIIDKEKPLPHAQRSKLHGYCLSTDDVEQVKLVIYEFCKTCLMPYIEKQLQQLNDAISNKKGVSRSFLSATKRWFNPNKPGAGSVAVNNLIYAPDSPELQVRRLGDLYFMFGHYGLAFQAYHLAKRDYNTDQAWLYYAGALEMASLAAFMANESNRKTCDYMEESITTYLNTCKMPQFATRATLLSSECLKSRGLYGEAAHQFIRMTSEESDLRSALFLEQAAYCFLHSKMLRKYAFHMVLAGHRFSKAAQRKHSLRSYKQAHQIYEGSGWDLAEDHIHFTIGRQAHNLHSFEEAVESFAKLLNGDSKQSAQQQSTFLKEYLTILGNKLKNEGNNSTPILALPAFKTGSLRLLMGPTPPLTTPGKVPALGINFNDDETPETTARWHKLEELLVQEASGAQPIIFKPLITLYTAGNVAKDDPIAIVNEPVQVCVTLVNTLQITLHMKDIFLLWSFDDDGTVVSNGSPNATNDRYVKTHVVRSALINANSKQDLVLNLAPLATGVLRLDGICYTLTSSTTPTDSIFIIGNQLFTPENAKHPKLLDIKVVPLAPCLQVTFSEICLDFLCDEVQKVTIDFSNTGTVPLKKILMATSHPSYLCNCETRNRPPVVVPNNCPPALKERLVRENHITAVPLPDDQLDPGQSTSLWIHIKAPNNPGPCSVDLLIYCESLDPQIKPKYRLVRHKWNLSVRESVQVEVDTQESFNSKSVEELAMVIKTTNLNKVHSSIVTEISILNVGILSRFWKLSENIVTPKFIKLHSQESAHILLKARRNIDKKSVYSNMVLNPERAVRERVNPAYMAFAMKTEQCRINVFDENEFVCRPNENGTIFLQWQASVNDTNNKRIVNGQTQVAVIVNRGDEEDTDFDEFTGQIDPANLLEVSINKEKAEDLVDAHPKVSYNLIHPPVVRHDFKRQKLCVVPVTLILHSIEQNSSLNVIVNTLSASNIPVVPAVRPNNLFYPFATRYFSWLGTGSAVRELKPLTSSQLELAVGVAKPGTFDLGARIEVYCTRSDQHEPPILQSCQIQSALVVIDGNS